MLKNENKKRIIKQHLTNICHISDKKYQRRVWIRGEGPECDDFDETVNYFFGEMDSILEEHKSFSITENQYQILKRFRDKFEIFADNNNWPHKFINTPEWDEIIKMAKEVLQAFEFENHESTI